MSEMFYSLEQDVTQYIHSIYKKIDTLSNQSNEKKEAAISEAEYELRELEKSIKQMEIEVSPLPDNKRREFMQKVRKYKSDADSVKKKFQECETNYLEQKEKEKLMGARLEEEDFQINMQQGTLLEQQNRRLLEARKTAYSTVDNGVNTQKELFRQTEVLTRNKTRLQEMDSDLGESNTLVNRMQLRIRKNKIILYSVFGFTLLAVVLIILSYF